MSWIYFVKFYCNTAKNHNFQGDFKQGFCGVAVYIEEWQQL